MASGGAGTEWWCCSPEAPWTLPWSGTASATGVADSGAAMEAGGARPPAGMGRTKLLSQIRCGRQVAHRLHWPKYAERDTGAQSYLMSCPSGHVRSRCGTGAQPSQMLCGAITQQPTPRAAFDWACISTSRTPHLEALSSVAQAHSHSRTAAHSQV